MADENKTTGFHEYLTYCIYAFVAGVLFSLALHLFGIWT